MLASFESSHHGASQLVLVASQSSIYMCSDHLLSCNIDCIVYSHVHVGGIIKAMLYALFH